MNATPEIDLPGFFQKCQMAAGNLLGALPPPDRSTVLWDCPAGALKQFSAWLVHEMQYRFGSLVVEEHPGQWKLIYLFYRRETPAQLELWVHLPRDRPEVDSISDKIHAADWHERQAEDLFGLVFTGHPRLGDFVLHEEWPEGVNPMRKDFPARTAMYQKQVDPDWRPTRILDTPGAFLMPMGPVYGDYCEAAQFFLETVGEDVVRMIPRFFFKYRGVEKLAEGQPWPRVLPMVERFSGTSAIAHATAFCMALERIHKTEVPPRARHLRVIMAELERLRHHLAVLSDICHASAMSVPSAKIDILEEEALRLSAVASGHRYLYGLIIPGGISRDIPQSHLDTLLRESRRLAERATHVFGALQFTSSFLDRYEGVGIITIEHAQELGLVGPIARACGVHSDLRMLLPYGGYNHPSPPPANAEPLEQEGDGYARIRLLFAEIKSSAELIATTIAALPKGAIQNEIADYTAGAAFGWSEAPKGATFHYVRTDGQGCVERYHITTPSFTNWHGFHIAAENFAFQDFPIMMASFGLSIAESDR